MADIHEPVTSPSQLPDFRLWLLDQWIPGGLFHRVWEMTRDPYGVTRSMHKLDALFDARSLETATLWWVTADMVDLIQHAAPLLPPTTLTDDLLPAQTGLVVYQKPLLGIDAEKPDHQVETNAVIWGDANIIEDPGRRYTSLSLYGYRSFAPPGEFGEYPLSDRVVSEDERLWFPMGRTDWGHGIDTDTAMGLYANRTEHELRRESMAEDRRWFAAFCLLAAQDNVVERTELAPARPIRRRSERRSVTSTVNLVDIRHHRVADASGGHRDVEWSHRWVVGGHWRQQAYGPGRTLRRPTYILPYIKGPDDKPLLLKDRVNVIKP